ncbi:hypothetical protein AVEN_101447-1 [Araneus ventricosus]|uniref:Uncharacterized protein n=1 Tax=Araneus ventricosus TaxID=182803 RepID=A0A4Y2CX66_ARAVE|nr:hypothetical protein AVEN_101447-1 [Araneus ventricosus]
MGYLRNTGHLWLTYIIRSTVYVGFVWLKSDVKGQASSRWCGMKVRTGCPPMQPVFNYCHVTQGQGLRRKVISSNNVSRKILYSKSSNPAEKGREASAIINVPCLDKNSDNGGSR